MIYFDARTKIHLKNYLKSRDRDDDNPALFVFDKTMYMSDDWRSGDKITRAGPTDCPAKKMHPHKFRPTMATRAIDKGMPIEQVQQLLGHAKIDTTMHYTMVNQTNVKNAHQKFIG